MVLGYSGTCVQLFWLGFSQRRRTQRHTTEQIKSGIRNETHENVRHVRTRAAANAFERLGAPFTSHVRRLVRLFLPARTRPGWRKRERAWKHNVGNVFDVRTGSYRKRNSYLKKSGLVQLESSRAADIGRASGSGPLWRLVNKFELGWKYARSNMRHEAWVSADVDRNCGRALLALAAKLEFPPVCPVVALFLGLVGGGWLLFTFHHHHLFLAFHLAENSPILGLRMGVDAGKPAPALRRSVIAQNSLSLLFERFVARLELPLQHARRRCICVCAKNRQSKCRQKQGCRVGRICSALLLSFPNILVKILKLFEKCVLNTIEHVKTRKKAYF